jgi:nucleoside-diphosphate-sugar epimerase
MRVAVTGATGFVGKAVVPTLLQNGHAVRILVRNPAALGSSGAEPIKGDLNDPSAIQALVSGMDAVIHLAGAISAPNRAAFFAVNCDGTRNLVEAISNSSVKRVVHLSSMAAREPDLSSYAASKAAGEVEALKLGKSSQLLVLRPCAVYGPGDVATLPLLQQLARPTAILPGRKHAKFALIHVQDLADVVSDAVSSSNTGIIEVDDADGPHSWPQLAQLVNQSFGTAKHVIYLPRSIAMSVGLIADIFGKVTNRPSMTSMEKMRELYHVDWSRRGAGWPRTKTIPLAQGLLETLSWYARNGKLPASIRTVRS